MKVYTSDEIDDMGANARKEGFNYTEKFVLESDHNSAVKEQKQTPTNLHIERVK